MQNVLKAVPDERLQMYVIFDPVFGGNFNRASRKLANQLTDRRVRYFKDPDSLSGMLWEKVLKTERAIAWDVYLLYDADAQWENEPPKPAFWMHQLGGVTIAPRLDEEKFTEELKALLKKLDSQNTKKVNQ